MTRTERSIAAVRAAMRRRGEAVAPQPAMRRGIALPAATLRRLHRPIARERVT